MAVHLEAKVGQFFTHQASEKFIVLSEGATELAGSRVVVIAVARVYILGSTLIHSFVCIRGPNPRGS